MTLKEMLQAQVDKTGVCNAHGVANWTLGRGGLQPAKRQPAKYKPEGWASIIRKTKKRYKASW